MKSLIKSEVRDISRSLSILDERHCELQSQARQQESYALSVVGGRRGRAKNKQTGKVGRSVKKKGTIGAPIYCRVMWIFSLFHA